MANVTPLRRILLMLLGTAGLIGVVVPAQAADVERNWALKGTASQSSTALGSDARRANDGNENGDWNVGSVTHTNSEIDPYWEIDLGASHYIDEIRVYNRTDCCQERLHGYLVFFANNREGFTHRDLNSTMGQNTGNADTGVYFKPVFSRSGDIDPTSGGRLARQTIKIQGTDCNHQDANHRPYPGCLMRYVRIQIGGQGILSLAEVEVIEKATVSGPAVVADAVSWKPTSVVANGGGAALTASDQNLLFFYRDNDNLLHGSVDFGDGPPVIGSPLLSADSPSTVWNKPAAINASKNKVYVAARTAGNEMAVVENDEDSGALTSSSWNMLGKTNASPALINACNRIIAAWLDNGQIKTSWKPTDPSASSAVWSVPVVAASAIRTPPTLAADMQQNVGMSFLGLDGSISFTRAPCIGSAGVSFGQDMVKLVGQSWGDRASLAAFGPHFILATIGGDGRGYLAVQRTGADGQQIWQGFEQIPASMRGDPGLPLMEAPRLLIMSGAIIAVAREKTTGELLYWTKYPNRLASGDEWMGGRVVGGSGRGAIAPLLVSFGHSQLSGMQGSPAELYIATRGIGDSRIYAMNLGRFIAKDVLLMDLHLDTEGMINIPPQPDRGLDETIAPNLFEQMVALLALPKQARDAVIGHQCGNSPLTLATFLELDRGPGTGQYCNTCPFEVVEYTGDLSADSLIHEWMHVDSAARTLVNFAGFADVFQFKETGTTPAESGMKACTSSSDCGGDPCELAGDTHGASPPFYGDSTMGFDAAETTIRRWDNTLVCVAGGGPDGRRYQGGLRWYDVGTSDHAFIHMAIAYRWYGDDLRNWVNADLSHGNDQLQRRYNWIKTFYFGGVEYNGRMDSGSRLPQSDRSLGYYGMPSK